MEKKNENMLEQVMNDYNALKYENMRLQELVDRADRLLKIAGFDKVYLTASFRKSLMRVIAAKYPDKDFGVSLTKASEDLGISYEDLDYITACGAATEDYFTILCDWLRPEDNQRKRWYMNTLVDDKYYKEAKKRYEENRAKAVEENKNYKYDGSNNYLKIYNKETDEVHYLCGKIYDDCKVGDVITYEHIETDWKGTTFQKIEAVVLETHCVPPYLQS